MEKQNLQPIFSKVDEKDFEQRAKQIEQGEFYISVDEAKKPVKKTYVVLYIGTDEEGKDLRSFEVIVGRKETFDFIKGMIEYLDIHESKVLTDNVAYKDAASVYDFMKYVSSLLEGESFDIEDYNYGYTNNYDPDSDEI